MTASPEFLVEREENLETAENVQLFSELISDEGKRKYIKHLHEQLDLPENAAILEVIIEDESQRSERINLSDKGEFDRANAMWEAIDNKYASLREKYGDDSIHNVNKVLEHIDRFERFGTLELSGDSGTSLLESLVSTAPNGHIDRTRLFVGDDELNLISHEAYDKGNVVQIDTSAEVEIPRSMFASAVNFESWKGRGSSAQKNGQLSAEVVDLYADWPEETAPNVEDATFYLLPDGRLFAKSGNSHRVAAALKRGDQTIKFDGYASVYLLDFIPESLQAD